MRWIRAAGIVPVTGAGFVSTPPSRGAAGVFGYSRSSSSLAINKHKRSPHLRHDFYTTACRLPVSSARISSSPSHPHRAIATTAASMSRHPDFKTVEGSRPDWDASSQFRYTKTADPDWKHGSGANSVDPGAASKKHISIDPYEPGRPATFNYKLLISSITPRPIGFVSTRSGPKDGGKGKGEEETFNLAPFSYFNVVCTDPPIFALGVSGSLAKPKDTLRHLTTNGECTVNIISEHFIEAANATSVDAPTGFSEWAISGLTPVHDTQTVRTPRVGEAVFSAECRVESIREFESRATPGKIGGCVVLLEGFRFWVREDAINEERNLVDPAVLRPMSRFGGITYGRTTEAIELPRPVFERDVGMEEYERLKKLAADKAKQ